MQVCLYLDRGRTLQWHRWLADALTNAGNQVHVRFSAKKQAIPKLYDTLFTLERNVYSINAGSSAIASIEPSALPASAGLEPFDVLIQLATDDRFLPAARRILTPCFNSMPTVFGAVMALVGNDSIIIEIHDSDRSAPLVAYPAVSDRDILVRGLDSLLSCTAGLILKTLATHSEGPARVERRGGMPLIRLAAVYEHAAKSFGRKGSRYLQILANGNRTWATAWRYDSASLMDRGSAAFQVLPNRKGHYYADPFPFRHNGIDLIFVEDFDHAKGYAGISVATINSAGASMPRPVLDTGHHLSYPFVFAYDDQIWMIPESGADRNICLYRAIRFPDEWRCEGILFDNIEGGDTTLLLPQADDRRFWLFVSERMWNSTGWDTVSLFHSDRLLGGQWTPHPGNPIEFDARYSRPGGRVFRRNGYLIRPVQDCSRRYGGAVNLCQIDRIDDQQFGQHVIGSVQCAPTAGRQPYQGCHTYNYCDGLEVIDIFDRGIADVVTAFYRPIEQTKASSSTDSTPMVNPVLSSA